MKKRNLNKKMRILSVGLLASTAVLSVENTQPILAEESNNQATKEAEGEEIVTILSSSEEVTNNTTEDSSSSTYSTEESIETEPSATEEISTSATESSTTDSTLESTTDSSSESSNSSSTTDTATNTSTTSSSSATSSSSSSATSSSSSSTTPSSSSSTSSSSSSSAKPKPAQPTQPSNSQPSHSNGNNRPASKIPSGTIGTPNHSNNNNIATPIGEQVFHISPNLTTKSFVKVIGEDARNIAGKNNLYASVMIAQAILESASGNSALASAPNYNLFGIKGSYKGQSANFLTSEDDGTGGMYSIRSNFRKYPSYKESLGDYVKLIRGGTDSSSGFYSGTWKTNTKTYKDATKYLTGRYATDTSYASKLNSLIEAYDLAQYDHLTDKKASKDTKIVTGVDKVEKRNTKKDQQLEFITHIVKKGESLKSISDMYNISTIAILEKNQLDRRMLYVGQKLLVPKQKTSAQTTLVKTEDVVDRSLSVVKKVSSAFTGQEVNVPKTSVAQYNVSASRKKTAATYKVKKNDTLASISKETGISVWSLKEWNQLDKYFLTEGQLLVLAPSLDA